MKILYISQYFPPEMGAPSARVYELSKYWVKNGHQVTVLTCFPNYPDGIVYDGYKNKARKVLVRENKDGVNVLRVWVYPTHLRSSLRRGINYLSSLISYTLTALFMDKYDIVITTSPPPPVGLTGLILRFVKGTPFIFEVRDLWPEVISAVGAAKETSFSYKLIDVVVSTLYKKSNAIVALTNSFKSSIVNDRLISEEKITVIENAVDTEFFRPDTDNGDTRKKLGLDKEFIVSYVGTIGLTHGVDVILGAAEVLIKTLPDVLFLIVGDGYERNRIEELTAKRGLTNIRIIGKQPRDNIPLILNSSDASLVLSKKSELLKKTIFAKIFEPMACGIPIIVAAEGESRDIIVNGKAGIAINPEDHAGLADAIETLYGDKKMREQMGRNAREYVTENFNRETKASQYLDLISKITTRKI